MTAMPPVYYFVRLGASEWLRLERESEEAEEAIHKSRNHFLQICTKITVHVVFDISPHLRFSSGTA